MESDPSIHAAGYGRRTLDLDIFLILSSRTSPTKWKCLHGIETWAAKRRMPLILYWICRRWTPLSPGEPSIGLRLQTILDSRSYVCLESSFLRNCYGSYDIASQFNTNSLLSPSHHSYRNYLHFFGFSAAIGSLRSTIATHIPYNALPPTRTAYLYIQPSIISYNLLVHIPIHHLIKPPCT